MQNSTEKAQGRASTIESDRAEANGQMAAKARFDPIAALLAIDRHLRAAVGERPVFADIVEKVGKLSGPKFSHLCRT